MNNTSSDRCRCATDVGLLLLRLAVAAVFMYHGAQKLLGLFGGPGIEGFAGFLASMNVPMPKVSAYLAAGTEFFGGALMLLGLAVRWVAWPMVFTMVVAIALAHGKAFSLQHNGMEYALTLALVLAALGLMGAGRLSVDRCRGAC